MTDERIKELMEEGESCFPYGITIHKNVPYVYYNLFEGLSEIPESEQKVISEMWRDAMNNKEMRACTIPALFDHLDKLVRAYWAKCAKHQAESEHE